MFFELVVVKMWLNIDGVDVDLWIINGVSEEEYLIIDENSSMNEEEMNGIDNEVLLIVMSVELLYLLDGIVLDIVELILVSVELM